MGKKIYPYMGFTTADIIAKASNTCNYVDASLYVDCSLPPTAKVRNVIDGDSNKVGELNAHVNVNKWSNFGPYTWHPLNADATPLYGRILKRDSPSFVQGYQLGDFCGYNHNAVAAGSLTGDTEKDFVIARSTVGYQEVNFNWAYQLGEVDYSLLGVTHFALGENANGGAWDNIEDISTLKGGGLANIYRMIVDNGVTVKSATLYAVFGHMVLGSFEPIMQLELNTIDFLAAGHYSAHAYVRLATGLNGQVSKSGIQPGTNKIYLDYTNSSKGYSTFAGTYNHGTNRTITVRAGSLTGTIIGTFYNEANQDNVFSFDLVPVMGLTIAYDRHPLTNQYDIYFT